MARLDSQDRSSGCKICSAHNVCSCPQVRTDTHALEDRRCLDKALHVGYAEIVRALSDWRGAGLGKGGGQETDVGRLVRGDFLEIAVKSRIETSSCKLGLAEVGKTLAVEGVFEMLQSQSVVEDVSIRDLGSSLPNLLQAVKMST